MPSEKKTFVIPDRFSFDEDIALKVFLRDSVGCHVEISAQNLRKIDTLLAQYLIAAAKHWKESGFDFELLQVPPDVCEAMLLLGIDEKTLTWKVAA